MDGENAAPHPLDELGGTPARPVDYGPAAEPAPEGGGPARFVATPAERAERPAGRQRFQASEVSFGLFGRLVITLFALLVLAWLTFTISFAFGIVGVIVYGGFFLPRILRDTWRR